jgi:hypothetical protein
MLGMETIIKLIVHFILHFLSESSSYAWFALILSPLTENPDITIDDRIKIPEIIKRYIFMFSKEFPTIVNKKIPKVKITPDTNDFSMSYLLLFFMKYNVNRGTMCLYFTIILFNFLDYS